MFESTRASVLIVIAICLCFFYRFCDRTCEQETKCIIGFRRGRKTKVPERKLSKHKRDQLRKHETHTPNLVSFFQW